MTRKRWALAAGLGVLLWGCAEPAQVELGAILSLEGPAAAYGRSIADGVRLAADLVNEAGGVDVAGRGRPKPLVLLLRDCASDPQRGAGLARELIERGVPAVIGGDASDVTLAIAPLFEAAGVVLLSPSSSSPKITDAGAYIFRNYPSDDLEALNLADHIYNREGIRQVAVIANQNEYGMGIKNAFIERFRALGGTVLVQETYPPEATDFSAQVEGVLAVDPPAIYIAGYSSDTAAVVRAIRGAGSRAPLFGSGAVLPASLVAEAGEAAENLVFPATAFDPESEQEHVRRFVAAFRGRYGRDPDTYAAHGFDAVNILVEAIRQMGTRPSELRFYLNTMSPYEGVAGSTKFDDHGDVRKFHRMFVIRQGRAVPATVVASAGAGGRPGT